MHAPELVFLIQARQLECLTFVHRRGKGFVLHEIGIQTSIIFPPEIDENGEMKANTIIWSLMGVRKELSNQS
jgi:hypothetical protein